MSRWFALAALFLPLTASAYSCGEALDGFCRQLTAPGGGNLDLALSDHSIPIRLGKTAAGVPVREIAYAKILQDQKAKLPADFVAGLQKLGYFEVLDRFVKAGNAASPKDLEALQSGWSTAIALLVQARVTAKYPELAALKPPPVAFHQALRAEETALRSQLVRAVWEGRPEWKQVQASFRDLRKDYVETLKHAPGLDSATRREWSRKIKSVEIELPSGFDDADNGCSPTSESAHYSIYTNRFVVCPGMFLGGSIDHVMAHELSHALGIKRTIREFLQRTSVGQGLDKAMSLACEKSPISECPREWPALRAELAHASGEVSRLSVPEKPYLECLQTSPPKNAPSTADVQSAAQSDVDKLFDNQTSDDWWKALLQPTLAGKEGKTATNPDFLNPCQPKTREGEVSAVDNPSAFFAAMEYACASSDAKDRMSAAVQAARRDLQLWDEATLGLGGKVSKTHALEKAGVAQDSEERFADTMATEVLATKLRRMKSVSDRRQTFLADSAFLCGHGLKGIHLSDQARHGDLMRLSMRSALECEEPRTADACSLNGAGSASGAGSPISGGLEEGSRPQANPAE